jgi:hypothetical protein
MLSKFCAFLAEITLMSFFARLALAKFAYQSSFPIPKLNCTYNSQIRVRSS